MRCFAKKEEPARDVKNGQVHCHDEGASHHLPTAAAVLFVLHTSAGEELRCSTPYLFSGPEERARGQQHLHDKKKTSTWR
jgi:hypothetical protein